jgi:phasin
MAENVVREFTDKGAARAKDTYEKTQAAAEETKKAMEQTFSAATKGTADFNAHLLEIAQANMNAAFDFARQLARVKSPSEFLELSTAHAHKQFETFTEQTKRLTSMAQTAATEATLPLQAGISKTFNKT